MSIARALIPFMLIPAISACTQETPEMKAVAVVPAETLVLTGELYYDDRTELSEDSRARIIIQDASVKSLEAPGIFEKIIELDGQQVPITFKVQPKSAKFAQLKTYSVMGSIIDPDDKPLWTTDKPYVINPFGGPQKLGKMKLVPFELRPSEQAETVKKAAPLKDTEWTVTKLRDEPFVAGSTITLKFADNKLSGSAGCNSYTAGYEVSKNALKIMPAGMTKKMCEPELMAQEGRFAKFLPNVESYKIREDGSLVIQTSSGIQLIATRKVKPQ